MRTISQGRYVPRRIVRVLAITAGIVAGGPAIWAVVSLLPSEVDPATADYMVDPLDLTPATRAVIGAVAAVVVAAAVVVVARAVRRHALDRSWLPVVGLLAGVAAYLGLTYAAVTAPTIGANIGGGLVLMAGGLLVPLGVAAASVMAWRASQRPRRPPIPNHTTTTSGRDTGDSPQ